MHSRRHDSKFSTGSGRTSLHGPDIDVIVLTMDLELFGILQQAAGPEHIVWHAESADEAVELLVGGRCGVLIADLQVLHGDAAALLDRLQVQFPELVLLAMGRRDQESSIGALVTSGRVYRFLHKPVSPARASLFISTAARRHIELGNTTSPARVVVRQLAQPAQKATFTGVALAAVALAGLWVFRAPIERLVHDAVAPPGLSWQDKARLVDERLAAARSAVIARRLAPPQRQNALHRYRSVLELQPHNQEALAGVQRIIDLLEQQVIDAISAGDTPKAAQAFSTLQHADPKHPRLDELRAQLLALSRGGAASR